jgi:hypothetical protein
MSFVVKAVKSVVKAVVNVVSSVVKAVVNVVSSVINFVMQPFMGLLGGMPDVPSAAQEADRQQGVLVQQTGSNVAVPVVYGYRKVGGAIAFAETGSTNNKYLYVAYVFSEGPVEGLREVYIDDWMLPAALTGNLNAGQVVDVNADRYNGRVRLQWYPGVYFNNIASSPVGAAVKAGIFAEAPSFKDTMDFNGLAVLFARYEWKEIKTQADADSNPFGGNIPAIQISMLGRRVASLLVDTELSTYDSASVRYSTNPAEILLDYLRNPRYGKGLLNDDIHWNTWKWAARKCNQTVTYLDSQNITGPILTSNYVLGTDQTIFANVKNLLMGFRSYMPYVQGKYKLKLEDAGNPTDILSGVATIVATFDKNNIVGDVTYTGIDKGSKYNVVAITYVDPDQKFSNQQVIYPETEEERQVYINLDGGRENKLDATFPTLTNYAMAKDMARLLFNKSRRQETCSLTVTSQALELEPGDCIRINSNILNFGTDPWRVISVKLNDNMTVELGCVRNPDDIYPYTRVGEEDIVLPTYVPKGSIIYFPGASNEYLLGLVPPTHAIYPSDFINNTSNPGATNPEAPGGGGVGGGDPVVPPVAPEEPVPAPITPVPPVNNPPVDPPKPVAFAAALTLKSVKSVDQLNGTSIFNLIFTQPSDGLYDRSIFWWRLNKFSPWVDIAVSTKPGAGGDIPVTIGPLVNGVASYEFYIRSYATDNRASTLVTNGNFQIVQDQTTGQFVGSGTAGTVQVAEGWTLPASQVPTNPVYNDNIDFLEIKPKLSAGVPLNPRRVTVTVQQLVNTITTPFNSLIDGVRIYYRFKGDTYWDYENFKFAAGGSYYGQQLTFDLTGDFGAKVYPGDALYTGNALQQYEFLVRLTYSDGHAAEKQMGPAIGPVEQNATGQLNYVIFGTASTASANVKSLAIPTTFTLLTVDQDPNRTFAVGSDIEPVIQYITSDPNNSKLTFQFKPPVNPKFRGYKIRYREVTVGTNPTFNEITVNGTPNEQGTIIAVVADGIYRHGTKFEWAITAQYSLSGVVTNCIKTYYGKVMVPMGNYVDLVAAFNLAIIDTTLALNNLKAAFPGLPTINPKSWIKKSIIASETTALFGYGVLGSDMYTISNQYYFNTFYKLSFQPDATNTHLIIYRRVYDVNAAKKNTVTTTGKYSLQSGTLGAWEKVRVALSSLATVDSWKEILVRGPLNSTMFDPYYQVTAGSTLLFNYYGPSPSKWPYGTSGPLNNVYPYAGVGNTDIKGTVTRWNEFIFVLGTASTEETIGLRLRDFYAPTSGTGWIAEQDGFLMGNVAKDEIVTLANFNGFDAGYKRNLNEAITVVPHNRLHFGSKYPSSSQPGVPNTTDFTNYTIFVNNPGFGTVY